MQPLNISRPVKSSVLLFISALDKLVQSLNAIAPMFFTLAGTTTFVSAEQPLNASVPIIVTLSGIITDLSVLLSLNAPFSIVFALSGITTVSSDPQYFTIVSSPLQRKSDSGVTL